MKTLVVGLFSLLALTTGSAAQSAPRIIDDFETLSAWDMAPSDGVTLRASLDRGLNGRALRLDFDFHGGGGYAVARKRVALDLPANYAFSWQMRATAPRNDLEFKLVDASGDNVWWSNQRDFEFPTTWRQVQRKRRHIEFAWGPAGGGEIRHVVAIELAITAGTGGKGTVWIDDFQLLELSAVAQTPPPPIASAMTSAIGHPPSAAVDGDTTTAWRTETARASLDIDLGMVREIGGVRVLWEPGRVPRNADILVSPNGTRWEVARRVRGNARLATPIRLPEWEARYVRLTFPPGAPVGVREVQVLPLDWAKTPNDVVFDLAGPAPRGTYPRGFSRQQSYWTVVGVDGDSREGLLSGDGALEVGKGAFTVEPLVVRDGRVSTWADVQSEPSLASGSVPIPSLRWTGAGFALHTEVFAAGPVGASRLFARYRLRNTGSRAAQLSLALAIRPYQVNPPWQFLQVIGGVAPVRSIDLRGRSAVVNGARRIHAVVPPSRTAAVGFDGGEPRTLLSLGALPTTRVARDDLGLTTGLLVWDGTLAPGGERVVDLEIPLYEGPIASPRLTRTDDYDRLRRATEREWARKLAGVALSLPDTLHGRRIAESVRASLAYILINRDGPALQPGSRSYERSWIRDGALTSTALLRLGHFTEVRDFVRWYAAYQYSNGRIPCCVDERGAGPVPEHDSNGEFIYLVAEYFRHTGDSAVVRQLWPNVMKATAYLDSLRAQRRTAIYRSPDSLHLYGLLPPSISHEGYSAKPMHSYWDDFFALRGYKDAAWLATTFHMPDAAAFIASRDEFRADFMASIARVMAKHRISFIPGAADLGDFDATSTTIAVSPVDDLAGLPPGALDSTFARYYREAIARRDGTREWNDYTPYELRTVGTFVRLLQPQAAHTLLDFFLRDQRPGAWRHWAEVVWRDPRTPRFIGDMPHTWVASDFIRSALDFFAFERERDSALVVGTGVRWEWLVEGIQVRGLSTHYGRFDLAERRLPSGEFEIDVAVQGTRIPPGGIVLRPPVGLEFTAVRGSEGPLTVDGDGSVRLRAASAVVRATVRPLASR